MASRAEVRATIDDLYRVEGKAELIAGKIVHLMAFGYLPSRIAFRLYRSLHDHAEATGLGEVFTATIVFVVPKLASGRESFSPDASFFFGPFPEDEMKFLEGPPTFAVEVRSEGDYGRAAESEMAAKRADYFEAGTLAVWDVDPIAKLVHLYRADAPTAPITFKPGDDAHADPAVPGWRIAVDRLFG